MVDRETKDQEVKQVEANQKHVGDEGDNAHLCYIISWRWRLGGMAGGRQLGEFRLLLVMYVCVTKGAVNTNN